MLILQTSFTPFTNQQTEWDLTPLMFASMGIMFSIVIGMIIDGIFDRFDIAIRAMLTVVGLSALLGLIFFLAVNISRGNGFDIQGTQKWAKETYLVELTDEQTEALIKYRMENTEIIETAHAIPVKYYDKDTLVQLVKIQDTWMLFMNDQELPVSNQ